MITHHHHRLLLFYLLFVCSLRVTYAVPTSLSSETGYRDSSQETLQESLPESLPESSSTSEDLSSTRSEFRIKDFLSWWAKRTIAGALLRKAIDKEQRDITLSLPPILLPASWLRIFKATTTTTTTPATTSSTPSGDVVVIGNLTNITPLLEEIRALVSVSNRIESQVNILKEQKVKTISLLEELVKLVGF